MMKVHSRGHRRQRASELAGLQICRVSRNMTDDDGHPCDDGRTTCATGEKILPMEKPVAEKMHLWRPSAIKETKMEAWRPDVGKRSTEIVGGAGTA